MKRLLLAVFIGLLAVPAHAGWNLRQNDDGTTSWVREDSEGSERTTDIGEHVLTLLLQDISTASTSYIAVPSTDVRISRIQTAVFGSPVGGTEMDFYRMTTAGAVVGEVTNGTTRLRLASGTTTGSLDTFTPNDTSTNNFFEQGEIIAIHMNGGSSTNVDAAITVTIIPR